VFKHKDEKWMQNIATENNLSETAFVEKIENNNNDDAHNNDNNNEDLFLLRWLLFMF
jgi:hypothetical protein